MSAAGNPKATVIGRSAKRTNVTHLEIFGRDLAALIAGAADGEAFEPGGVLEISLPGDRTLRIGATESVRVAYTAEHALPTEADK